MPLRLMCVTAHPDDECGAFGGALLRAAARGAETAVLCLTEGAAGSYRSPGQTDEELAVARRVEFDEACRMLAVQSAELLHYPDGALWQEPFLELVSTIVARLRRFRPHVVLTFAGDGGVNQHRDHTVISLATTAAFHWSARSELFPEQPGEAAWAPQKLYYSATHFLSSPDEALQKIGTLMPASLRFHLPTELRDQKLAAFGAHASQRGVLDRVLAQYADKLDQEDYLLIAARQPVEGEQDFWDGVEE